MDRKAIADRLRELRGGKRREEVALACGVTAQAISMYETGARIPNDEIKVRLADYYGQTVQSIFYAGAVNDM